MNAEFRINGKEIETERLILRAFRMSDLEDFYEYASVEGVGEMAGWKHHADREVSRAILERFVSEDRTFALCLKENGKVIGSLGVEKYDREDAFPDLLPYRGRSIGYVLGKAYWGRGLMPEAVKAVIDYLFNDCKMDFLFCGYYDFNNQSRRVQEKVGFRPCRKLVYDTKMGTKEPGVLNLMGNPSLGPAFVSVIEKCYDMSGEKMKTVYDFTVKDRKGNSVGLSEYKGKVLLIVNTATGCGFTPHYEPLEAMYKDLKDKGLEILDFPCNQFANQAPGDAEEIHQFCTLKFGADFPQFAKIDVNGDTADPLFAFIATEKPFTGFGKGIKNAALNKFADMNNKKFGDKAYIKWNFTKFLVDREGKVVARFEPTTDMGEVRRAVEAAL